MMRFRIQHAIEAALLIILLGLLIYGSLPTPPVTLVCRDSATSGRGRVVFNRMDRFILTTFDRCEVAQ